MDIISGVLIFIALILCSYGIAATTLYTTFIPSVFFVVLSIFFVVLAIYFGIMHFLIKINKNTKKGLVFDNNKEIKKEKQTAEKEKEEEEEEEEEEKEETEKAPFRNKVLIIVIALIVVSLLIPFFISFFGG